MFHRYEKKASAASPKSLKNLTAMVSVDGLLAEKKREDLVLKILESSGLEEARFNALCMSLMENLINHCQLLPQTSNSYYAFAGGLLDHALNRTEAALHLFRQYALQEGSEVSEEQRIWLYALLCASLLQGIGKLQIDYKVELFDEKGQRLKQWNPLLESLTAIGKHYDYQFEHETNDDLRRRLNILMAKQLMPQSGFSWIANNKDVLATWLALLNEDWQSAGTLGALLVRADAIAIQRYFSESFSKHASRGRRNSRMSTFVDSTPESVGDKERIMGIEFIQWLMAALENGQVMLNKAPLFMVPGGMLMSSDAFKLFVREHPEFKNWQAIQNGFLSLGLHETGTDGSVISRFEQAKTQQMVSGVVFANYQISLPEQCRVHNLNTGKVSSVAAIELAGTAQFSNHFMQKHAAPPTISLQQLNANGKWQEPGSPASKTGNLLRG